MIQRAKIYIQETFEELRYKVSWPSWQELQSSAVVVLIASLIIALTVYAMDMASKTTLSTIYDLFE